VTGYAEHFVRLKRPNLPDVEFGPEPAAHAQSLVRRMVREYQLKSHNVETVTTFERVTYVVDARRGEGS
jgi:hypothetical protein